MELSIYLAVLCSALMNATWNSLVHADTDRTAVLVVLLWVEGALALCALPFVTLPGPAAWGWLVAGTALRVTYTMVLLHAYARAELSRIYPIARGVAPVLLGLFGVTLFGERLGGAGVLAVAAIACGVLLIARVDRGAIREAVALRLGVVLSSFIAAYSLVDARGVRASEDPFGYAALAFLGEVVGILACVAFTRGASSIGSAVTAWRTGIPAGFLATASYLIALWAFSRAPAALVAALRETSVLFALVIARASLRERVTARDWFGGVLIVGGAAILRV